MKIRIEIDVAGVGIQAHEYDHCPIHLSTEGEACPMTHNPCRYGLTDIMPPTNCPMRHGPMQMQFSVIEEKGG